MWDNPLLVARATGFAPALNMEVLLFNGILMGLLLRPGPGVLLYDPAVRAHFATGVESGSPLLKSSLQIIERVSHLSSIGRLTLFFLEYPLFSLVFHRGQ